MSAPAHRARSWLFVPGDRPERFAKAARAGADATILDLEDAVSEAAKTRARTAAAAWLSPEHPAYVRINPPGTEAHDEDLAAMLRPGLAGLVVPKAEDPDATRALALRPPRPPRSCRSSRPRSASGTPARSRRRPGLSGSPSAPSTSSATPASTATTKPCSTPARDSCSPRASPA